MPKFVKGQSGNPGGRRKRGQATIDLLAEIRLQLAQAGSEGIGTQSERLVQALIDAGIGGDVRAIALVLDRIHGPVVPNRPVEIDMVAVQMEVRRITEAKNRE